MRFLFSSAALSAVLLSASSAFAADDAGVNAIYSRLMEAVDASDAAKLDKVYTADATFFGPDLPAVVDRESVKTLFFSGWQKINAANAKSELHFRIFQRIWNNPDTVTDIGYSKYILTFADPAKQPKIRYDKFVTQAQKQPDGSWAWRLDVYNNLPDATAAATYDAQAPVGSLRYDS
jgi:ketosteroid isomerase-like protein